MNELKKAAAIIAAVGLTVAVFALEGGGDEKAVVELQFSESKVVWDGGDKLYAIPVALADGGSDIALVVEAPCKRRLPKNELCFLEDGGLPAELLRYPAQQLSGICDNVACSVFAGEDADAMESRK
jgi:hypothetical protein